jgi:hypothetical protein
MFELSLAKSEGNYKDSFSRRLGRLSSKSNIYT